MQHEVAIPRDRMAGRIVGIGHHRQGHHVRHGLLKGLRELPCQFVVLRYPNSIIPAPAAGRDLIDVSADGAEGGVSPRGV